MAARFRKIDPRIWTDEKFRQLTGEQQRIALYILTAQSNRIGLFSFSPGKACEDLKTLPAAFRKGFENVCQALNWEWDSEARVLYLPTWWRYNQPESVNNVVGNLKDLDDLPATPLFARFAANTTYLLDAVKETFLQTLAKGYPHPSPKPSPNPLPNPSPTQEQEQEQEQETPPAVDHNFEEFWNHFPARNGKKLEKGQALAKFSRLTPEDRRLVLVAVKNYTASEMIQRGIGIKDAHRWIRNGKDEEPWREWLTPEIRKGKTDGKGKLRHSGFADKDYGAGSF